MLMVGIFDHVVFMFIDEVMASDVVEKFGQDFAYVRRTSLQTFCSIVQKRSLHARMVA